MAHQAPGLLPRLDQHHVVAGHDPDVDRVAGGPCGRGVPLALPHRHHIVLLAVHAQQPGAGGQQPHRVGRREPGSPVAVRAAQEGSDRAVAEPGRTLTARGRFADSEGKRVIYNPWYELGAG